MNGQGGLIVWFTGLSGAGKSTIANEVSLKLSRESIANQILDGDVLRQSLSKDLGFSKEDRDEHVARVSFLGHLKAGEGFVVLVALISPYQETRLAARRRGSQFIEVYVNASLNTCERRDIKGLYRLARQGKLSHFTGVSDPYEPPTAPEVECYTDKETITESADKVLTAIYEVLYRLEPIKRVVESF